VSYVRVQALGVTPTGPGPSACARNITYPMSGLVAYDSPSPAASASIVPSRAGTPSVGVAAAVAGAQAAATAIQGTSNVAAGSSAFLVSSGQSTDRTVPPPSSDAQRGANRQKFEVELEVCPFRLLAHLAHLIASLES
jgi:hypothetical protein